MIETYRFVDSLEELRFTYNHILPRLKENEVYFLCAAARNKKLSQDERSYYGISRAEMYDSQIVRTDTFESFMKAVYKFEINKKAFTTKNGYAYPDKSLILYLFQDPIDAYAASKAMVQYILETQGNLTNAVLKNSEEGIKQGWYNIRKIFDSFKSIFAKNRGTKVWLDVDIDVEFNSIEQEKKFVDFMRLFFNAKLGSRNYIIIRTAGGFHVLIKRNSLKENPQNNINALESYLVDKMKVQPKEIGISKTGQIPLPGTIAYSSFTVHVLNKEDFNQEGC